MAHAVRIKGGKASYSNRFVDTNRRALERQAGYAAVGKIGDMRGAFGLVTLGVDALKKRLGVVDAARGLGTANTALAAHAGRLLALNEGDLPYALRLACDGLVETLGRLRCGGAVAHPITAHPKTCPRTGELFAFGYSPAAAPFLHFTRFAADGAVAADFPVPIPAGAMIHDCAITDQHMVFVVPPLLFKPEAMVKTGKLPFVFDKSEPLRIGVMDRNADDASGVQWFELPSLMCFHTANAWVDANGRVELHLCTFRDFSLDSFTAVSPDAEPYLSRAVLDLRSGAATVERLSPLAGDFPTVPAALMGRKTRYAYVATFKTGPEGAPLFYGVAKIDLAARGPEAALVGLVRYGEGRVGGEAVFVPRPGGVEEDDGYLATFVVEEATGDSQLVLYDAKTMASAPVAAVRMPARVPAGFHGLWVGEDMIG